MQTYLELIQQLNEIRASVSHNGSKFMGKHGGKIGIANIAANTVAPMLINGAREDIEDDNNYKIMLDRIKEKNLKQRELKLKQQQNCKNENTQPIDELVSFNFQNNGDPNSH
jgi:hypothetical protein